MGQGGRFTEISTGSKSGFDFLHTAHQEHSREIMDEAVLIFQWVMFIAVVTITSLGKAILEPSKLLSNSGKIYLFCNEQGNVWHMSIVSLLFHLLT